MIPALFTSSSALTASQEMLSVVGNNLANTNTTGFKAQTLLFSNQFSDVLAAASEPTSTSGGLNPIQIGMGVQVAATDTSQTEGTFQSTGNPLDLAIQNNGYFMLNDNGKTVYTRAGSFAVSSSGYLIDPSTGAFVQREGTVGEGTTTSPSFQTAGNSNIYMPNNLTIPGAATQNVTFSGNLSATATAPVAQQMTLGSALTVNNQPATLSTSLDALDETTLSASSPTGYAAGDTIVITGTTANGTSLKSTYTMTGTPSTDTVGALIDQINQAFESGTPATGATASLNSAGQIVLTANSAGPSNLSIQLSSPASNPSGTSTQFSNFTQTAAGAAGTTATSVVQIYDVNGSPHEITFTFEKEAANTWNITASMNSADGTITGFGEDNTVTGVTFNQNGSLQGISGGSTSEVLTSHTPLTAGGVPATLATTIQGLDQTSGTYGGSDTIQVTGTDYNGKSIVPITLPVTDTVGDMINAINTAFHGTVAVLDSSGNIEITSLHPGQSSMSLSIADSAGNSGSATTLFPTFDVTTPGTNGNDQITFQVSGLSGNGASQTVNLDLGTPDSFTGVTQTGGSTSVNMKSQDGYAQGTLESSSVGSDGVITGQFTNGQTEAIAQIALASFNNPGGLQDIGNNYLTGTTASGQATISAPGSAGVGTIQSGGVEGSNVDVGTEFTNLIAAQQGYEVNAKAFSIANSIMTAAVNLIST